jgi:hypothetical protein
LDLGQRGDLHLMGRGGVGFGTLFLFGIALRRRAVDAQLEQLIKQWLAVDDTRLLHQYIAFGIHQIPRQGTADPNLVFLKR